MKRTFFFAAMIGAALAAKAQTPLRFGAFNGMQPGYRATDQMADTNALTRKWFVSKYAGLSTGFTVFNGGSATFVSAPVGLQLNRRLTDNVYAFAGVSVAPTMMYFNNAFGHPGANKQQGFMNPNNYSINPAAHVGLMYISNDGSFSVSGSFGVSRNRYMGYSPFYNPATPPVHGQFAPIR